jgi:hypothetical protein
MQRSYIRIAGNIDRLGPFYGNMATQCSRSELFSKKDAGEIFREATKTLRVTFYCEAIRCPILIVIGRATLERANGREDEAWRAPAFEDPAEAGFPPLVFYQLLLSHRSLEELRLFCPDVRANENVRLLIDTLFPK